MHRLGLRGQKLGPTYQGYHPLDDRALAVYERAEQLRPADDLSHGHDAAPLGRARVRAADPPRRNRPDFPDAADRDRPRRTPVEPEALVVVRKHAHVYADVSALVYRPFQLYHTLRLAIDYAVDHKLLLGSDFPWLTTADSIAGLRRSLRRRTGSGSRFLRTASRGSSTGRRSRCSASRTPRPALPAGCRRERERTRASAREAPLRDRPARAAGARDRRRRRGGRRDRGRVQRARSGARATGATRERCRARTPSTALSPSRRARPGDALRVEIVAIEPLIGQCSTYLWPHDYLRLGSGRTSRTRRASVRSRTASSAGASRSRSRTSR